MLRYSGVSNGKLVVILNFIGKKNHMSLIYRYVVSFLSQFITPHIYDLNVLHYMYLIPLYISTFQINLLYIFFACIYTCIYVLLTFFTFSSLLLFLPFNFVCGCCGVCFDVVVGRAYLCSLLSSNLKPNG
jgi:hypothetical protein